MKNLYTLCALIIVFTTLIDAQTLTATILPQYIEGATSTNTNRVPFVYRAKLSGLTANATYRYTNQIVISTDKATAAGAGNCIFASETADFVRTSGPALATAGAYGTFTTDANGVYEGWFINEPTGNATRFIPGKYVFMRISLNDGGTGTTAATLLTTTDSVKVVKLDATASDTTATGIRSTTPLSAKKFVFLYDNVDGTGRPISGTFIESDGTDNSTANSYASFYATSVNGVSGAFGTIIPNNLTSGIQRVEVRSFADAAIETSATDADGVWPSGLSTVGATGGTTELVLLPTDLNFQATGIRQTGKELTGFSLGQNYPNPFNPSTQITFTLAEKSNVRIDVFSMQGEKITTLLNEYKAPGLYSVTFNAAHLPSGIYMYRITAGSLIETKQMVLVK